MRPCFALPLLFTSFLTAQSPTPELKPETVLATIDGKKLTYGELQAYLDGLGPENKQAALANRKQLLQQYALMTKLVEIAQKDKLETQTPYKEALEANRKQILTRAELQDRYNKIVVGADEQKKFYDANNDRYTQVKLQVLYLGFVSDAQPAAVKDKKYRTEAEAKTEISTLRAQIHSAGDFKRLVKQYSEDETSKAKDGDYGVMKKSDNLPPDIKSVVFALKEGEVSQPVPQRNGFYLFRADSVGLRPYAEVKDEIYSELKDLKVRAWIEQTQNSIPVKVENEAFFAPVPGPVPPMLRPN